MMVRARFQILYKLVQLLSFLTMERSCFIYFNYSLWFDLPFQYVHSAYYTFCNLYYLYVLRTLKPKGEFEKKAAKRE